MKKRFGILMCVLIIASLALVYFNNSSVSKLKEQTSKLNSEVQSLEKEKNNLSQEKDKLLKEKQQLEDKLK
ncbi:hypothetical protein [Hathewaya massiliensis]|uniref:hypothetical protein n=1 Tax=Hathewaya massiliensis TaxID=1964382 RepID=UPI00115860E6|nr:hypothetical protein [Hathewaya massiliensis]